MGMDDIVYDWPTCAQDLVDALRVVCDSYERILATDLDNGVKTSSYATHTGAINAIVDALLEDFKSRKERIQ